MGKGHGGGGGVLEWHIPVQQRSSAAWRLGPKKKTQKKIKAPGSSGKTTGASAMRMRRLGSRGPRRVTLAFDSIELGGASLHGKH